MEKCDNLHIEYSLRIGSDRKQIKDLKTIEFKKILKDSTHYIFNWETQTATGSEVSPHIHGYMRFPVSIPAKTIRARIKATPWYKSLSPEDRGNGSYSLKQIPSGKWKDSVGYLRYIHKQNKEGFDFSNSINKSENIKKEDQIQWNKEFWQIQEKIKSEKKKKQLNGNTCKQFLEWIQDKYTVSKTIATGEQELVYNHPKLETLVEECSDFLQSINSSYVMPSTYERLINYVEFSLDRKSFNQRILEKIEKYR